MSPIVLASPSPEGTRMGPRAQPGVVDADLVPKSLLDRGRGLAFPTVTCKNAFGHHNMVRSSQKVPPRFTTAPCKTIGVSRVSWVQLTSSILKPSDSSRKQNWFAGA
ncbi:unnamed protein product [Coccothraustes coccothraustes]